MPLLIDFLVGLYETKYTPEFYIHRQDLLFPCESTILLWPQYWNLQKKLEHETHFICSKLSVR